MMWLLPVLFAAMFLLPPVFKGRKAGHHLLGIIRPQGPINPDGSTTVFSHVHEKGEFRLCDLAALLASVAVAALPASLLVFGLQIIASVAASQIVRSSGAVDYAGHGAEIIAAERGGEAGYRAAEIARMAGNRDKRGDDIGAELARWHWLARVVFVLGRV